MENIKIVGHRGVRGIDVENTKGALARAQELGVDAVEFDVRLTKDRQLVLCHNRNLKKIYGIDKLVSQMTLTQLQKLSATNGESLPTLQDVLDTGITVPLLMDVKNAGSADLIYQLMQRPENRHFRWMITTFVPSEAARFKQLDANISVSMGTIWHPFSTIEAARKIGAEAITINAVLLNFADYIKARRAGLSVMVYMNYLSFLFSTPWIVKLFRTLYPGIIICTDRPDKIVPALKR